MTDIEVALCEATCHRCDGPLLASIRVPHQFCRADGGVVEGLRTVTLCRHCDGEDPSAQGVFAFFALHERIESEHVREAGDLLREWIDAVLARPAPSLEDLSIEDHPDWQE